MSDTTATPAENQANVERDTLLRQSYTAASKRLREAHLDEFNALHKEEAKSRGIDWSPKPTAKEKARKALADLLSENPDLIDEIEKVKGKGEVPANPPVA